MTVAGTEAELAASTASSPTRRAPPWNAPPPRPASWTRPGSTSRAASPPPGRNAPPGHLDGRGLGSRITDVDGTTHVDLHNGFGHARGPGQRERLRRQGPVIFSERRINDHCAAVDAFLANLDTFATARKG